MKAMDALIEKFLTETKAVQPIANPACDPAKYHPEDEGKGKMRDEAKPKAKGARRPGAAREKWRSNQYPRNETRDPCFNCDSLTLLSIYVPLPSAHSASPRHPFALRLRESSLRRTGAIDG